ncbi:MAG: hypothetical protein KY468_13670 [Armatimonadetes bacterium]|nr:hypothetical protein [Armatimonadota bacterium]
MDAREALELRRRQIVERLTGDQLQIQPGYPTAREEILRPDRLEAETAYFWDQWAPRLGPSATLLIVRMRQACRRAGSSHEPDASVSLSYGEIGRFCGMSASTIKRLLQQDDVRRFIRKEAQMRESAMGMVDAPNRYVVMMTDPLTPEDEDRLRDRLADRLLTRELLHAPAPSSPQKPVRNDLTPPVQIDPEPPVQNEHAGVVQNEPVPPGQIGPGHAAKRASLLNARNRRKPGISSPPAPKATMQNVKEHEERNVNNVTNGLPYIESPAIEDWALRLVELTGDDKSINFYRKAARILLQRKAEGILDHAVGRVKEAMREGKARRPAALLTSTLLTLAEEQGIFITDRSRQEADQVRDLIRKNLG